MADTKTTLRELSVIYCIIKTLKKEKLSNISDFCKELTPYANSSKAFKLIKSNPSIIQENLGIIKNAFILAGAIIKTFKINSQPSMIWTGEESYETPTDLIIEGNNISLKEESFILENMGLYRLILLQVATIRRVNCMFLSTLRLKSITIGLR